MRDNGIMESPYVGYDSDDDSIRFGERITAMKVLCPKWYGLGIVAVLLSWIIGFAAICIP